MKVLLDTSFILSCVSQKIDFNHEGFGLGIEFILPEEVINELSAVSGDKKKSLKERNNAKLSLDILKQLRLKTTGLGEKFVDKGIIKFLRNHQEYSVATLDNGIRRRIKKPALGITGKKIDFY